MKIASRIEEFKPARNTGSDLVAKAKPAVRQGGKIEGACMRKHRHHEWV